MLQVNIFYSFVFSNFLKLHSSENTRRKKKHCIEDHVHYIFKQILLSAGFLNFEWRLLPAYLALRIAVRLTQYSESKDNAHREDDIKVRDYYCTLETKSSSPQKSRKLKLVYPFFFIVTSLSRMYHYSRCCAYSLPCQHFKSAEQIKWIYGGIPGPNPI